MSDAAKDLDLSILPPNYRAAFEALQATAARATELEGIVKRLEHLVAELNHVLHGKKSEKLSEDERQLAFEDLQIAVAETEEQKQDHATGDAAPKRKQVAKRNRGSLPEHLPRIERIIEPDSLVCPCPCGCRQMHKIGVVLKARLWRDDRTERLDIVPAQLRVIRCPAVHVYMHERGHRPPQIRLRSGWPPNQPASRIAKLFGEGGARGAVRSRA